jgi:hypothetical protein
MRRLLTHLLAFVLTACAAAPAPETAPEPDPASVMLPETPKLGVEALEEGNDLVLVSKRGEQELDRLVVRKVKGLRFDKDAECLFDSPANEVDYQIASLVIERGQRQENFDPELYAVYGASKNDGKFKKFPKRAASCYFTFP